MAAMTVDRCSFVQLMGSTSARPGVHLTQVDSMCSVHVPDTSDVMVRTHSHAVPKKLGAIVKALSCNNLRQGACTDCRDVAMPSLWCYRYSLHRHHSLPGLCGAHAVAYCM